MEKHGIKIVYLRSSPTHDIPGADGTFGNTEKTKNKNIC